ncbi:uncharacterized protein [Typha angustifolia]|uniref:uncharacterized protein n=1 Tax=Typha angustifolia TaxID=59011 RepID=UPI003C2C7561
MASYVPVGRESVSLVSFLLVTEQDWITWASSIETVLRGRCLLGHIDGISTGCAPPRTIIQTTIVTSTESDTPKAVQSEVPSSEYGEWELRDMEVCTYLILQVDRSFRPQLQTLSSAQAIWAHLSRRFVQSSLMRRFQLRRDAQEVRQGQLSIQDFYARMTDIWRELTSMEPTFSHPSDSMSAQRHRDEDHLMDFLNALCPEFGDLTRHLLHRSTLPSLDSAIAELQAEELRQRLTPPSIAIESVLGVAPAPILVTPDISTAARVTHVPGRDHHSSRPMCTHCGRPGHLAARCYRLHPELVPRSSKGGSSKDRSRHLASSTAASNISPSDHSSNLTFSSA